MRSKVRQIKHAFLVLLVFAAASCERTPVTNPVESMKSEQWWTYLADYDGFPGSTVVDLGLKPQAPVPGLPTVLVTGVSYESSPESSGLPTPDELIFLTKLSAKRLALIASKSKAVFAGTFTHKSERLDYIYISDSTGLESILRDFYKTECPDRRPYINLKSDPRWEAYLSFLFPNQQAIDFYRAESERENERRRREATSKGR